MCSLPYTASTYSLTLLEQENNMRKTEKRRTIPTLHPDPTTLQLHPMLPVQAENAGLFISRGTGKHPERIIHSHELIFVRSGILGIQEEDHEFLVQAGQTLLLWPERRHYGTLFYQEDLSFYWVHFNVLPLTSASEQSLLTITQYGTVKQPDYLNTLFRRFLDAQEAGYLKQTEANLLLLLMLWEAGQHTTLLPATEKTQTILAGRASEYISTHFHEPISTMTIAQVLNCNPDYLGRIYQRVYKQTITEAIHRRRLAYARKLLLESRQNTTQIALACGFEDSGYFRRVFKRYEGLTPFAFRRLYAQVHVNTE